MEINIVGAGLAGCEAALQLANRNIKVNLFEMRPKQTTGAHKTDMFAEFVCSNSLGSKNINAASGLLKKELEIMGSYLLKIALETQVNAGEALAIDRQLFSSKITKMIKNHPNITVIHEEFTQVDPNVVTIFASGPLTSKNLFIELQKYINCDNLYFYDAIAPIVEKDSINFDCAFYQNRYQKGEPCYINCPMNEKQYRKFYDFLISAPTIELKDFEKDIKYFEGCMPIEVLAKRGFDTLRYGPLKPIGLIDPRTSVKNYAVVQLREDNLAKSLYNLVGFQTNLKWSFQKELINLIPGLESANVVKFGVMHKNIFINSPKLINNTLNLKKYPNLFFAGQILGTEGYTESIAMGLMCALNVFNFIFNKSKLNLPNTTLLGALTNYISFDGHKNFQPINANWGILQPIKLDRKILKNKKLKNERLAQRSIDSFAKILIDVNVC